jgi:hypothetical protein
LVVSAATFNLTTLTVLLAVSSATQSENIASQNSLLDVLYFKSGARRGRDTVLPIFLARL